MHHHILRKYENNVPTNDQDLLFCIGNLVNSCTAFCLLPTSCLELRQYRTDDHQSQLARDLESVLVWQVKRHVSWLKAARAQEPLSPSTNGSADTQGLIWTKPCLSTNHQLQLGECFPLGYKQLPLNSRVTCSFSFIPAAPLIFECFTKDARLLHRFASWSVPRSGHFFLLGTLRNIAVYHSNE